MPEVYQTLPSSYPKVQSNPSCSICYGTGYKYQKKQKDWRVCEYCAKEYNTPMTTFDAYPNLIANTTLYASSVPAMGMTVPSNLPVIKSSPNCAICQG